MAQFLLGIIVQRVAQKVAHFLRNNVPENSWKQFSCDRKKARFGKTIITYITLINKKSKCFSKSAFLGDRNPISSLK